jgi:acetylornithine deacetylase
VLDPASIPPASPSIPRASPSIPRASPSIPPAGLTAAERAVWEAIDVERLVAVTSQLVAVPTLSADETPGQQLVAAMLSAAGMDVETWDVDVEALAAHPYFSAEVERDQILGVVGRTGTGDGPTLLIDGHIDVVPTGAWKDWTTPPFEPTVRDGRLYGRGTCDMKGGLAAAIHAVEAIRAAGIELAGTVAIASVAGEEDGGSGTLAMLEHGVRADACIIPEPSDLDVVPAVAGALSWRIRVRGLSAHGCLREEGVSAIEAFHPVHQAVLQLERDRNDRDAGPLFSWLDRPFAICGGRIAGGDWPSSEADWVLWEGRYGVAPGEDLAAARGELEDAVASAANGHAWLSEHPPELEWWGGQFHPGATDVHDPIVTTVRGAATEVLGREPALRGMPYGCDLGLTVNVGGIPTVVFGPGNVRDAHSPDESVPIDDLEQAARVVALAILRTCGVRSHRGPGVR